MKLSIVVPTFNQGPYIRDCLESIQRQTFADWEVVIQDGLSTDDTQSICEAVAAADSRVRYFREQDFGQSDAINRGLERTQGHLWTWICSDDRYSAPRALDDLIVAFDAARALDTKCVGVFGDAQFIYQDGKIAYPYGNQRREIRRLDFKILWPFSQPALLILRRRVLAAGGVDTGLYLGMDLDLFFKYLADDEKFLYCPTMVADIRLQPSSKSVKFRVATAENALALVKKHTGGYGNPHDSAFVIELAQARVERALALFFRFRSKFDRFEELMFRVLGKLVSPVPFVRVIPRKIHTFYRHYLHKPLASIVFRWTYFEAKLSR